MRQESEANLRKALELSKADEQVVEGRVTKRMTAGLLRRAAQEQCTYKTLTLCSKLELTLEGLRDLSAALSEYSHLTYVNRGANSEPSHSLASC